MKTLVADRIASGTSCSWIAKQLPKPIREAEGACLLIFLLRPTRTKTNRLLWDLL